MVPIKILNPTPNPLTIQKGKPIGEFQILDWDTQIHGTEPGKSPSGMSHYCSHASFQNNDTTKQKNADFLSNYKQMSGQRTKSRKSNSYCWIIKICL